MPCLKGSVGQPKWPHSLVLTQRQVSGRLKAVNLMIIPLAMQAGQHLDLLLKQYVPSLDNATSPFNQLLML